VHAKTDAGIMQNASLKNPLFLLLVFSKKCFNNLIIGDVNPVCAIKQECRSHYYTYCFVNVEIFLRKKQQKNPDAQIKKHHENSKQGMKLFQDSIHTDKIWHK
jgi:hypothetical protein